MWCFLLPAGPIFFCQKVENVLLFTYKALMLCILWGGCFVLCRISSDMWLFSSAGKQGWLLFCKKVEDVLYSWTILLCIWTTLLYSWTILICKKVENVALFICRAVMLCGLFRVVDRRAR